MRIVHRTPYGEILESVCAVVPADFRRVMRRVSQISRTDQLVTHTLYPCYTVPYINHSTHSSAYSADSARKVTLIKNLRNAAFASTLRKSVRKDSFGARKVLFAGTVLVLFALSARAQTPKDDLVKLNKAYLGATSYSMHIDMRLYMQEQDTRPMMSYSGTTMRNESGYKAEMMGRITLVNADCALLLDSRQHLILYRALSKEKAKTPAADPLTQLNIDSLIGAQSSMLSYLVNTATEKRIQIVDAESSYKRIEISLDPESSTLRQIVYVFRDRDVKQGKAARVVIDYRQVSLNKPLDRALFSEATYIRKRSGNLVPADAYRQYRIIDEGKAYTD